MVIFTTSWLTTIFKNFQGRAEERLPIQKVTTDSREETSNSLFIPIIGEKFDGHDFILQAIDNGAKAVIWDKNKQLPNQVPKDFPVFLVNDTVEALQLLAFSYRDKVNPIVIGITGSNGKTTTKDIIASILKQRFKTHHTLGNLNNHIGVPLTILSMDNNTEVLVLEMGMNNFGEIELLTRLAQPDYAVITNIGESHIEFLHSRAGIAQAKLEITHGLKKGGCLILDGDEELLEHKTSDYNIIKCGFDLTNDVVITDVNVEQDQTHFHLSNGSDYIIPLLGKHHAKNASFGITVALQVGMTEKQIKEALVNLNLTSMRFEMIKGINGASIINDAYNASPTSMMAAIEVVKELSGFKEKILVLGDIFELGSYSKDFHESIAEVIEPPITGLFTYGEAIKATGIKVQEKGIPIDYHHFDSADELVNTLQTHLSPDSIILFKASRGMHFENFVKKLKE